MWIFPDYGTDGKTQLRHNNVHYGMFVMTIQADAVRKLDGSPIVVLVGPAGRGKTTALQLAMVCAGQLLEQIYHYLKSSILIPWV